MVRCPFWAGDVNPVIQCDMMLALVPKLFVRKRRMVTAKLDDVQSPLIINLGVQIQILGP
jgi:hypothetical protein